MTGRSRKSSRRACFGRAVANRLWPGLAGAICLGLCSRRSFCSVPVGTTDQVGLEQGRAGGFGRGSRRDLAWAGHAAGGLGLEAILHPAADVLHPVASAARVGALVPLALLLGAVGRDGASLAIARTATLRFSTLGIASVATLLVTGTVNTWYLSGSIPALVGTDYGRLLLAKVALFLGMVAIAAVNRLRLTRRLVQEASMAATRDALRQLRRNAAIEAFAGALIVIVAVLGTNRPACISSRFGHFRSA